MLQRLRRTHHFQRDPVESTFSLTLIFRPKPRRLYALDIVSGTIKAKDDAPFRTSTTCSLFQEVRKVHRSCLKARPCNTSCENISRPANWLG